MLNDEVGREFDPQGLIAPEILVDADRAANDADLVEDVVDFVNWALESAYLVPGEIAPEAFWSYYADYYRAEVNNGGHSQFAFNSDMNETALDNCRRGLEAMGASDYLVIFNEFLAIMQGEPERAEAIRDRIRFQTIDPDIRALDDRFFKLRNMTALNAAWLRTLPSLRPLPIEPENDLEAARDRLVAANKMLDARIAYLEGTQDRFKATDPVQVAARATCAQEGITFERLNAGIPESDGIRWDLSTSSGHRTMLVAPELAVMRAGTALRGLYFFGTKSAYATPAGNGAVRASLAAAAPREVQRRAAAPLTGDALAASTEQICAECLMAPFFSLCAHLTDGAKQLQAALVLNYFGSAAGGASYVPRSAAPKFAKDQDHALVRLVIANLLFDMAIVNEGLTDAMLEDHERASALLINLGAGAAAAACSFRLLECGRLTTLAQLDRDDLVRERENIRLQLIEIGIWWLRFVGKAIAAAKAQDAKPGGLIFTNPRLRRARAAAIQLAPDTLGDLAATLAYFDSEYPTDPVSSMQPIYDHALGAFAKRFASSARQAAAWTASVAAAREAAVTTAPPEDAIILINAIKLPGTKTETLVGTAGVLRNGDWTRAHFHYLDSGERQILR
ncbi:DMP19 family protein [Bradyrhizobium sp. HKCCYLS2038]|uniref:DMP19 family protein n=1 Tax=unclassified Bradyrhizobium TaxID=2631580 RepID=UPI003EBC07F9